MAKRSMGILVFLLCFCISLMPCQALAASTADAKEPISIHTDCSLTLCYGYENAPFSQLPVKLYKIADASEACQYSLTSRFANSQLELNGIQSVGEWNVIRSTLETHILAGGIPEDFSTVTDSVGQALFDGLKPGLYLAIADRITKSEATYVFDSALIALPGLDAEGHWQYHIAVTAKSEKIPNTDEKTEFKVVKLWKGDKDSQHRPKNIEIEIFRNGISFQTVTLSEENHWTYRWSAPDDGSDWKVVERNIPAGYTMTVEQRQTSFVLTNTFQDQLDTPPPQTADTSHIMLYVVLLFLAGSGLMIVGMTGKRNRV